MRGGGDLLRSLKSSRDFIFPVKARQASFGVSKCGKSMKTCLVRKGNRKEIKYKAMGQSGHWLILVKQPHADGFLLSS